MRLIRVAFLLSCAAASWAQPPADLATYSPAWTTPGADASDSMPIGNGEVGLNVWTEPDGDIVFYLARTDAWSEASRLMKIGRVRVELDPPLMKAGREFVQHLDLPRGVLRIASTAPGDTCEIELFVHPDTPVVYLGGRADTPRKVKITHESWRTESKRLTGSGPDAELTSSWTMHSAPDSIEVIESADHIFDTGDRVAWCHRNETSVIPLTIAHQGLTPIRDAIKDPLLHRTFGAMIVPSDPQAWTRPSPSVAESAKELSTFSVRIPVHSAQTETMQAWRTQIDGIIAAAPDAMEARRRTEKYWADFWARSYIFIEGDRAGGVPSNAHEVTLGQDCHGENRFTGRITRASLYREPLAEDRIAHLAGERGELPPSFGVERSIGFGGGDKRGTKAAGSASMQFPKGFTIEAVVNPGADLKAARIIDKVTAGQDDGFLFDIQPNATLRLIVGSQRVEAPNALKLDDWSHVAATYDAASDRLRLFVNGKAVASSHQEESAVPSLVTRGYILQRWVQACGGRGNYPIKFNGSIFTVEAKHTNDKATSPDYRRWGDCYWWQNTRLPYHPMLASGDFEMMAPLFSMYRNAIPACEARAKLYHNVTGAYFPETMTINGLYSNGDYGWDRTNRDPSEVLCPWWQWAWNQGPELVALMLDQYAYTQDQAFASNELAPTASSVLRYFDTRFKRDANGKLVISPTQALETHWHNVINDMPCVAGLHDITARLLALPAAIGSDEDRELWRRIQEALPPIPTREVAGVALYAPAEAYKPERSNVENPELANIFPHRLVGVDSPAPELEMARETYRRRHDKATQGWTQDGQIAALLGLTTEAQRNIVAKSKNSNPRHRFPAMWGPNFDWVPDQCHGSNLMHVLQCMLLQPRGDKILLLPAWPKEWNVSFRLHAPQGTVVECEYRDGQVTRLEVTPESRRGDVEVRIGAP